MVINLIPMFIHAEDDSDLLDSSFELTDKGVVLAAKMKITFSRIPGSGDSIKEFMKKVGYDVSQMRNLQVSSSLSTLGQVLKSTKAIMDRLSQVVHFSDLNHVTVNVLIKIISCTPYSMHHGPLFPAFTR